MAEILQKEHKQKAGVRKTKKASLRVDLTPMVDLGFLLISFFVFTTTISQPKAMKLVMPNNGIDSSEAPADKTLNLILAANNKTCVYNGSQLNNIKNIGSNTTAIREAILQRKNEIREKYGNDLGMIVLIKPTPLSTYANVVNALNEMLICDIKTYVLMDATEDELKAIKQ
ncbi:MAG TPA: biopolymer transporter ExbD [Parafilimonas sp.]|jgi:biopolymer transport protein ExbD